MHTFTRFALLLLLTTLSAPAPAQWAVPDKQEASSDADIKAALTGGVPGGRWKEGLMFEGISPQPWLKSRSAKPARAAA